MRRVLFQLCALALLFWLLVACEVEEAPPVAVVPTATVASTATPLPTATSSPTATPSSTVMPSPTMTPTLTPSATATPTVTPDPYAGLYIEALREERESFGQEGSWFFGDSS